MMLTKHKNEWGLCPSLQGENDSLIFKHSGTNEGFKNYLTTFVHRGNVVIIMTNADNGGKLIDEILISVSGYYDWGINNQRVVETMELPAEKLIKLAGRYKLNFQVPGIGDYLIEVKVKNNKLFVRDININESYILTPLEEFKFIDLDNGDEGEFKISKDAKNIELLFRGKYQFNKIDK